MTTRIVTADLGHLDVVVPLFDSYRGFYGCRSDEAQARKFIADRLTNEDSVLILAIVDSPGAQSRGIGFTQLYPSFSSVAMKRIWILNDLFVADEARRSGIGRQLLAAAADFGLNSGAARIELSTATDNMAAKSLYESVGYSLDQLFDHYQLAIG